MKLLVLSFYYPPDLSAGSFRMNALVNELSVHLSKNDIIHVITTSPNRYTSFSAEFVESEKYGNIVVDRVCVPNYSAGFWGQIRSFFVFAKSVYLISKNNDYDIVVATSSRLATGVLGALISHINRTPFYLDIRDIFVDTIKDVYPKYLTFFLIPFFSLLESWVINKACKVNLVSIGFKDYFFSRYPNKSYSFYTNGIDECFELNSEVNKVRQAKRKNEYIKMLYAGNIGEGQGLEKIIPVMAKKLENEVRIRIIGDGRSKKKLLRSLRENDVKNVEILNPVPRADLIKEYRNADVLFLHLNDCDAFKKVLPSKLFEYAASGKPILAGVSGYAAKFISEEVENAKVFEPCNVNLAIKCFAQLKKESVYRLEFIKKYSRKNIMKSMVMDIISIVNEGWCKKK